MDKPKRKYNRKPTPKQALATKILSENVGISVTEAKRRAGYSESEALQPQRLTRSNSYIDELNKAGVTDTFLARGHREALKAVELKERQFIDRTIRELVEVDKDSPKYLKGGREKQFEEITVYAPVSDDEIRAYFKKIPGAKLIAIELGYRFKIASYTMPLYTARAKYHELASKNKGLMAPEKHDHGVFHEPTEEEKKLINEIFKTK